MPKFQCFGSTEFYFSLMWQSSVGVPGQWAACFLWLIRNQAPTVVWICSPLRPQSRQKRTQRSPTCFLMALALVLDLTPVTSQLCFSITELLLPSVSLSIKWGQLQNYLTGLLCTVTELIFVKYLSIPGTQYGLYKYFLDKIIKKLKKKKLLLISLAIPGCKGNCFPVPTPHYGTGKF